MTISELISLIFTSGVLGWAVFYKSKRRTANAEATTAEVGAMAALMAQYTAFIEALNEELSSSKAEARAERDEAREARKREAEEREKVVQAYKERSDALVEAEIIRGKLALSDYNKCEVIKCLKRIPSRTEQQQECESQITK